MDQSKTQNKFDFDLTNYNQFGKDVIETNEEYRKALNSLKNELQKKEYEISSINSLYQRLKNINEQLRQECDNLNEKNILLINEKSTLETKYEKLNEDLESNYKNKINDYESKLLEYSSFNINTLRNKIENDYKDKYNEIIFSKEKEISDKNDIINKLIKEKSLFEEQYQIEINSIMVDMNTLKNIHKTETNELLQRIQLLKNSNFNNIDSINNEQFLKMKNELDNAKCQIKILTDENYQLKKDCESLTKEKNTLKTDNIILNDKIKFDEKKNEYEIKRLNNTIENLQLEINLIKTKSSDKEEEIKKFYKDKVDLNNRLSNKELECQELRNNINILNDLLKSHQDEINNNINETNKIKRELLLKGRRDEEKYKKEIEDLNIKLKEVINVEDFEDIINNKEQEIIKLKKKIKDIENDVVVDTNLIKKYNDIVRKKNFYKNQCKQANEKIEKIFKKLNSEQQKEFQNIFNQNKNNNNNSNNNNNIFEISESGVI